METEAGTAVEPAGGASAKRIASDRNARLSLGTAGSAAPLKGGAGGAAWGPVGFVPVFVAFGGKFTAGDGWISGFNVELVKDKLILQAWRGNDDDWPKGYHSAVRFRFTKVPGGTRLDFLHSGVPAVAYEGIRGGWREYYWEPLKLAVTR